MPPSHSSIGLLVVVLDGEITALQGVWSKPQLRSSRISFVKTDTATFWHTPVAASLTAARCALFEPRSSFHFRLFVCPFCCPKIAVANRVLSLASEQTDRRKHPSRPPGVMCFALPESSSWHLTLQSIHGTVPPRPRHVLGDILRMRSSLSQPLHWEIQLRHRGSRRSCSCLICDGESCFQAP